MHFRSVMGLAALMAVGCFVGCSMTNPTVRGQAPDAAAVPPNAGPIIGTAPGYGEIINRPYMGNYGGTDFHAFNMNNNNLGYEGGYYAGPNGTFTGPPVSSLNPPTPYTNAGGQCLECQNGAHCPAGGCRRCGRGCLYRNGMPCHYQTYQYKWPENLTYPQQGVPAGMVQYPYYTLRGPTDFFMDKAQ